MSIFTFYTSRPTKNCLQIKYNRIIRDVSLYQIDIPTTIHGSFCRGDIYISFKDTILQPSSPLRHATELQEILESRVGMS